MLKCWAINSQDWVNVEENDEWSNLSFSLEEASMPPHETRIRALRCSITNGYYAGYKHLSE